jgi:hypothetical protein
MPPAAGWLPYTRFAALLVISAIMVAAPRTSARPRLGRRYRYGMTRLNREVEARERQNQLEPSSGAAATLTAGGQEAVS